jgi:hypothetical protein
MSTKILENPTAEISIIINEIQLDLEYNFNSIILEYLNKIFLKSLTEQPHPPEDLKITISDLYELAEFNLLRATVYSQNSKEKELFRHSAYGTYLKIFEKYEDELSFEVCSNFEKIESTLDSTKFYGIRFSISDLLNLKDKNIPYINRRLLKLRYLDFKYSNVLF